MIEMGFGRLVGMRRVLRSPLVGSLSKNIKTIYVFATPHNYVINEDMDLSLDPIKLSNNYHCIEPLNLNNTQQNILGYLPTIEPFEDIQGSSELRNVIVDYIKNKGIRRPQYNIDRNKH